MMSENRIDRVIAVVARTLQVAPEQLSPSTARDDIEQWDSLGHILLIEELGKEFKFDVPAESALSIESVQDIINVVQKIEGIDR